MKLKTDTKFQVAGVECHGVQILTETGEQLENIVSLDTDTGEYEQYVRGADGNFVSDALGQTFLTKKGLALQFFFVLTLGPRKDLLAQPEVH